MTLKPPRESFLKSGSIGQFLDRRLGEPRWIGVLGYFYILLPVISFLVMTFAEVMRPQRFFFWVLPMNPMIWNTVWLVVSLATPVIGIGLIRRARFAYYGVIAHAATVAVLNSYALISYSYTFWKTVQDAGLDLLWKMGRNHFYWYSGIVGTDILLALLILVFLRQKVKSSYFASKAA